LSDTPHINLDDPGRFSRFELISWWEQKRLRAAKVLIIGAGALGNEILKNCALLGIGNALVADMDRVEHSNLSRSVLFRAADVNRFKAEAACEAARALYPEMCARPFVGNIVTDLGLGAYFWADCIIGGLDNREARVAVNRGAALAGKPWIDGAIEVLSGVVRVFDPARGACYECTMSAVDWQILDERRSCALLTRSQMEEGKVPTTPTTASFIAGLEVQEAIKLLHGMEGLVGQGLVFDGPSGEVYRVHYPTKPDCMGHDRCSRLEPLGRGAAEVTVGELLDRARADLGSTEAVLRLGRDVIRRLVCPSCGHTEDLFVALGKVTENMAKCPSCGAMRAVELLMSPGVETGLDKMTLTEIGVPPLDVITAQAGDASISYLLDGDQDRVLGDLAH
jgi:adenylyltransferase/sulfurtransferase